MRSRSDREKMRRRADPHRWTLFPGSPPVTWVLPDGVEYGSPELDARIRDFTRYVCEYFLAPGYDLQLMLVGEPAALLDRRTDTTIEFTAVRRDTSSLRDARWLSETPRGPRDG